MKTKTISISGILALLLAVGVASAEEKEPVKVFLLAGQSNMRGMGKPAELRPPHTTSPANVKIWTQGKGTWSPLVATGNHFGPEVGFAHAMAEQTPKDEIRLIKLGVSGSNLWKHWCPTEPSGPTLKKFIGIAEAALADLDKNGTPYEIVGMLWLQGESDAKAGKGDIYEENLKTFINHMRTHFKTPDMPFTIARVRTFYGGKNGHAKKVRDAQVNTAKTMKHVEWFDTDDCSLANPGHYDTKGQLVIGKRFAEAYKEMAGDRK